MADKNNTIYFDAQTTDRRVAAVKQAISAGKHIYCEKPTAVTTQEAYELYTLAQKAGVKNGVVQLSGKVPNGWERLHVLRVARGVTGVRTVEDLLSVNEPERAN
jgi:hypothetical protein